MCHKILLRKLEHYGIRGQALKLSNSFLHTRHQYVSYQNKHSKALTNRFSVPQGSNLGPLLFLIYVNDLTSAMNSVPRLFADDTCLLIHSPNTSTLAENINSELENVHEWTVTNKITVNFEKSSLIIPPIITTSIPDIQVHFYNNSVTLKDSLKYLGITIDARLNFDVHINTLTRKTSRSLGVITKLKQIFLRKTLRSLYYAMIHPYLLYGITIWGNTYETHLKRLKSLQNKAVKVIAGGQYLIDLTAYYKQLNILKIENLYTLEGAKLMHKFFRNKLPNRFSCFYSNKCDTHTHRRSQGGPRGPGPPSPNKITLTKKN